MGIHLGGKIVRTTFLGIECHVHNVQRGVAVVGGLRLIGIEFKFVDSTDIVVGQLVQVALNVTWGKSGTSVRENGIHTIPCQKSTVVSISNIIL